MTIKKSCETDIQIATTILKNCKNTPIDPGGISTNAVASIPIIIADNIVSFSLNSLIKLPEEAHSINSIKNTVKLIDCKFLEEANVLFIRGFVRKNIYYSLDNSSSTSKGHSKRHYLAYIPFKCTTPVKLKTLNPLYQFNSDNSKFKDNKKHGSSSDVQGNSNKVYEEFFNSRPFCELTGVRIAEQCKYIYKKDNSHPPKALDVKQISTLKNTMTIDLKISILQNLDMYISSHWNNKKDFNPYSDNSNSEEDFNLEDEADLNSESEYNDKDSYEDNNNPSLDNIYKADIRDLLNILVSLYNSNTPNSYINRKRTSSLPNYRFHVPWHRF